MILGRPTDRMRSILTWLLVESMAGVLFAQASIAGTCTDKVDCYCDTVSDANLLFCEDFESADFYENTAADFAAGSGSPYDRGGASAWYAKYGSPSYGGNITSSSTAPRLGTACGYPLCNGVKEYCSNAQGNLVDGKGRDCWGPGINATAGLDIQRSGDFADEIPSLTLTGGAGATSDVGSGRSHMAYRVPVRGNDVGNGQTRFTGKTEIGITMLHGYSSNLLTSGVLQQPWKHEEWYGDGGSGGFAEHWNMGSTGIGGSGDTNYFPYQPFMWAMSLSACQAAMAGAQVLVGSAGCLDVGVLGMTANGSAFPNWAVTSSAYRNSGVTNYRRSADFPPGTWQCHRAHVRGLGTSNMELRIWHNDKLVFHMTGFNASTGLRNKNYNTFWWNAYANQAGLGGLTTPVYRYRDNVHIRNGEPVACSAAWAGVAGSGPPPTPPAQPLAPPILLP